jgi:hypothetical protein
MLCKRTVILVVSVLCCVRTLLCCVLIAVQFPEVQNLETMLPEVQNLEPDFQFNVQAGRV